MSGSHLYDLGQRQLLMCAHGFELGRQPQDRCEGLLMKGADRRLADLSLAAIRSGGRFSSKER